MNNEIIIVIAVAIVAAFIVAAKFPKVRHAFIVLEGNPALMNLRLMQSLAAAQNAGNTLVVGMPGGFVPLKNGKMSSPASNTEESGAS